MAKCILVLQIEDDTPDAMFATTIRNWLASFDEKTSCEHLSPAAYAALIQATEMTLSNMKRVADHWAHSPDPEIRTQSRGYERFIDALNQAARVLGDPFSDNVPDTIAGIEHS